jgi:hypothetical protein
VGLPEAAARVEQAVHDDLAASAGRTRSTGQIGDDITGRLLASVS